MIEWEYDTLEIHPEELFEMLNINGKEGWEFVTLIMMQRVMQNKFVMNQEPKVEMVFTLIFKRQKS